MTKEHEYHRALCLLAPGFHSVSAEHLVVRDYVLSIPEFPRAWHKAWSFSDVQHEWVDERMGGWTDGWSAKCFLLPSWNARETLKTCQARGSMQTEAQGPESFNSG